MKAYCRLIGSITSLVVALSATTVSARGYSIDWVVTPHALAGSKVDRMFDHQVRWDFFGYPRMLFRAKSEIAGRGGEKVAPPETQFYGMRDRERVACTLEKSKRAGYASSKKRVCLIDGNKDGVFEQYAIAQYSSVTQRVSFEELIDLAPAETEIIPSAKATKLIDGTLFVTSRVNQRVSMELFLDGRSLLKDCSLKNQLIKSDDTAAFECGIPGLVINVTNTTLGRKARRIELDVPAEQFSIVFSDQSVTFF